MREHHPDKGGDKEKSQKINDAYEVLSDPEKRKHYDETGKTSPDEDSRSSSGQEGGSKSDEGETNYGKEDDEVEENSSDEDRPSKKRKANPKKKVIIFITSLYYLYIYILYITNAFFLLQMYKGKNVSIDIEGTSASIYYGFAGNLSSLSKERIQRYLFKLHKHISRFKDNADEGEYNILYMMYGSGSGDCYFLNFNYFFR